MIGAALLILAALGLQTSRTQLALETGGYDTGVAPESKMMLGEASGLVASRSMGAPSIVPPEPPGRGTAGDREFLPAERLIIKTAMLAVVVSDVPQAAEKIVQYAVSKGGFEVERNVYKDGLAFSGSVTVRIPVKSFDAGVEEAKGLGEVRSQQVNGQDVTEEFVDVQTQLKHLSAVEAQFLDILRRAQKIEDILAVQRELNQVQGQIEQLEGRKKYLQLSADLSTITVNLSTDPAKLPVVDEGEKWRPLAILKNATRSLVELGKSLVGVLIWAVVYIPVGLLLWVIVWGVRRWRRRQQKRGAQ